MEAVALVHMPKICMFMPQPSTSDNYTLLPLTGDPGICIGPLSAFTAARLTVASRHGWGDMGMKLKLLPNFSLQLNGGELINEAAFSQGPIWVNEELIVHGDNNRPLTITGQTVVMEIAVKMAPADQYMPAKCVVLTSVVYEPKSAKNAFALRETVAEMQQCYEKEKSEAKEKKQQ